MSRDLFTDTFTARPAPKRSKWMIGTSILAHVGVVGALLIIPIVSAANAFVLRANDRIEFSVPVVMPPPSTPPRPSSPSTAQPVSPVNHAAAPLAPPEQPVTFDVSRVSGPPAPDTVIGDRFGSGPRIPGAPNGTERRLVDSPPPVVQPPLRAGGDIKTPERTSYVAPEYPVLARAAKVEGRVILEATIDEAGHVRDVRVLRSDPLFDRAALEAVARWRYTPTRLNGVAVPILLTVTVTFALK